MTYRDIDAHKQPVDRLRRQMLALQLDLAGYKAWQIQERLGVCKRTVARYLTLDPKTYLRKEVSHEASQDRPASTL
jgi:hypothetical protein